MHAVALPHGGRLWFGRQIEREEPDGVIHTVCDGLGDDPVAVARGDSLMAWDRCEHPGWGVWHSRDGGRHCERSATDPWASDTPESIRHADRDALHASLSANLAVVWTCLGEGALWTSTDVGNTWARMPAPQCPLVSIVATDAGELLALSNRSTRGASSVELALSRWNPGASSWEAVDVSPPLRARSVSPTIDADADGTVWVVDDLGVTRVPPGSRHVARVGSARIEESSARHDDLPLRVDAVGAGEFVGSFSSFGAFVRLTRDGLAPWQAAPRALPPMVFWPDGAGGLYARGEDGVPSVHQNASGAWSASSASLLEAEFTTALAARGPSLAMVGVLGAVAWSIDGGARWSTARLPEAVGRPHRAVFTDAERLLVVGTRASVRLFVPTGRFEVVSLPEDAVDSAMAEPTPQSGSLTLLAHHGTAALLLGGAVYELAPDDTRWRPRIGGPRGALGGVPDRSARLLAVDETDGLWVLDGQHHAWSLDVASDRFVAVTLPVAHVFNTARAMAVTSRGTVVVATNAGIERFRLADASDVSVAPLPWSDPSTEVTGLSVAEGVTLVFSSQRVDSPAVHHRAVTLSMRGGDGSWRAVGSGFDVWAQDGDDLYVGRGDALWRASVRALLGVRGAP